jgi:arabinan endo-1,5-alpha-L-arabinosidase
MKEKFQKFTEFHFPIKPILTQLPDNKLDRTKWGGYFSHDPAIFYDNNDYFYTYSTDAGPDAIHPAGGQIRRSKDLISFEYIGVALADGVPTEAEEHTHAKGLWAPDIIKVENEYRLYYSASSFGSQNSAIGLAVSHSPEGPFIHKGLVIKTTPESPVNAIDANIVVEEGTGQHYMIYGSFWGGIKIIKLDNVTGLAAEEGYGITIASRPKSVDGAIEGGYIRYNPITEYYYLFVSYESLINHYNVRVGRSKSLTGPYTDFNGMDLNYSNNNKSTTNDNSSTSNNSTPTSNSDINKTNPYEVGLKITTGYSFKENTGWIAFGHNSVLDHNGDWYLICHARKESHPGLHTLHVHKMLWTKEGWPVISPFQYAGEEIQKVPAELLPGTYARIDFEQNMDHIITPYTKMELKANGTCALHSTPIQCAKGYTNKLPEQFHSHEPALVPAALEYTNPNQEDNPSPSELITEGTWKIEGHTLTIRYNNIVETIYVLPSWDYEEDTTTLAITGMNQNGICIWGKKL